MATPYRVQLANFTGPIDLLLHLIRVNQMDIFDLDLHLITQQYLAVIAGEDTASLENAYYFLLMASTLMEIKSKLLLPADEEKREAGEATGEEMKMELVRRLQTYQNLQNVVAELGTREQKQRLLLPPGAADRLEQSLVYSLRDMSLYDLITTFEEVLARAQPVSELAYTEGDLSVDEVLGEVQELLHANAKGVPLTEVLTLHQGLSWLVVAFLAVLELISAEKISFSRKDDQYRLSWIEHAEPQTELPRSQ